MLSLPKATRVGELVFLNSSSDHYWKSEIKRGVIIADSDEDNADLLIAHVTTDEQTCLHSKYSIILNNEDFESGNVDGRTVLRIDMVIAISARQILTADVAKLRPSKIDGVLRMWSKLVCETYYRSVHRPLQEAPFIPGKSRIPYAGRVYDEREIEALANASLDFWLTAGRYTREFEDRLASFLGVKHCSFVNSGSSANLLAFMALTSPKLGERRIKRGDEVITVAAGFPTTVAPLIQYGAIPVFVDVLVSTANIDCSLLDRALSERTRAVLLAHTLGNPFDLQAVRNFCDENSLWLVEDNCDALGARYFLDGEWRFTGSLGDIGTSSFYPPHHITTGEGGAVYTNDASLKRLIDSFRDWGRDCWCASGKDDTCGHRFDRQFGLLPKGYDHKYVYSHFGYNLKATDLQAAIGCAQIEKLPQFIESRKRNWRRLRDGLVDMHEYMILPEATAKSDPSWFGFLLILRDSAEFSRDEMVIHLESLGIQTRMLFAGNIINHPCFDDLRENRDMYRVVNELPVTEKIMNHGFWLGVYPGMTTEMIDFMVQTVRDFAHARR